MSSRARRRSTCACCPTTGATPDVLLLAPVAGELPGRDRRSPSRRRWWARAPRAGCASSTRTARCRAVRLAERRQRDLAGVHVLFLSEHDLPDARGAVPGLLRYVPMVALTRGWRGPARSSRAGRRTRSSSLPRAEVDPTGAGDVFAAAFLLRYHETGDLLEAAAFAACAASCAVEGVGGSTLGRPRRGRAAAGAAPAADRGRGMGRIDAGDRRPLRGLMRGPGRAAGRRPRPGAGSATARRRWSWRPDPGAFVIRLRPDLAPRTCRHFVKTAKAGGYDGTTFHRIIAGGIIQGGDPLSQGPGESRRSTAPAAWACSRPSSRRQPFTRGVVAAARRPSSRTAAAASSSSA